MNHKLLILCCTLLLLRCSKEPQPSLAQKNIKIIGAGTTFYSDEDYLKLVELTDTSRIYTITEFKYSMNSIAQIVLKYKDRAGAFPVLYNVVTNVAYETLNNMHTPYAYMGKNFMNEFGKHYLRNFHSYLLGDSIEPAWKNYYIRVAQNKSSILHLAMSGINAHITYDIPFVLDNINSVDSFYTDFKIYTDFIASTYAQVGAEMKLEYGVQNADNAFQLFAVGSIIDGINGSGYTTHLVIDMLRSQSWQRGMDLEKGIKTTLQMHTICFSDFQLRENILQAGDEAHLLN